MRLTLPEISKVDPCPGIRHQSLQDGQADDVASDHHVLVEHATSA
jgi:hypothetical protein